MNRLFWLLFLLATSACSPKLSLLQQRELVDMLSRRDYFELKSQISTKGKGLPKAQQQYYRAYLENAFNNPAASSALCERLLSRKSRKTGEHTVSNLLVLQIDNYSKSFRYRDAHLVSEQLLTTYAHTLDSSYLESIANSDILWAALAEAPPQRIFVEGETRIPWQKDKMGLMTIPVRFGLNSEDFVFDTGANLSTVSATYAQKLGIQILPGTFEVGSSTGQMVAAQIGLADAFRIGDILVQHAVFLVLPDEAVSFPQYDYQLNGIIGFPIIEQLREIRVHKNGWITVPEQPTPRNLQNLALSELTPMLHLTANGEKLIFQLDSGARQTALFAPYFRRHRQRFESIGQPDTIRIGGAGGMVSLPAYTESHLKIQIGDQLSQLKNVKVHTTDNPAFGEIFDGNLGQDVIQQFDEMILNFEHMYFFVQNDD